MAIPGMNYGSRQTKNHQDNNDIEGFRIQVIGIDKKVERLNEDP